MQIVSARTRTERWSLDGTGAARGRTERISILLDVTTDDGHTGTGEAAPLPDLSIESLDAARAALAVFVDAVTRAPIDFAPPGAHVGALPEAFPFVRAAEIAAHFAPAAASARFAIETALLSAYSAHVGASPTSLLPRVPVTILDPSVVVDDPDAAARAFAQGARFLKVKIGPALDRERVEAIARAAPTARLRLDANRSWPHTQVHEYLTALADLPVDYVEEPCHDADQLLDGLLAIPIVLDESLAELAFDAHHGRTTPLAHDPQRMTAPAPALLRALASPNLAALVLKPTLLGGFAPCVELARLANTHGKPVIVTHALESPVGRAACDALAAAMRAPEARNGDGPLFPPRTTPSHARSRPQILVAQPAQATIDAITRAVRERTPIALLHPRAGDAELARQHAVVEQATLRDEDAVILFTSGSTGTPRGVVHTWASIDASIAASAAHFGWRDDDRWLLALSTAHAGGLSVVVRCLAAGKRIVRVEREGDRDALVASLAESTLASLVPTQLAMLLDDPAWRSPPALRGVLLGGAAAPAALLDAAAARGVPFLTSYGLTETFGQVATAPLARAGDPLAPLRPLGDVVIEAGTRDAPEPIRIRGPMLAARYLDGAPIAPAYTTADLGFLDGGALHVVGRADDVIITGGENVHPAQIEAVLAATPGVRAACAFGIPDHRWGQIVGAALAVATEFDEAFALAHWRHALPPHARPRALATCTALPLLPSGKHDRRAALALPRHDVSY